MASLQLPDDVGPIVTGPATASSTVCHRLLLKVYFATGKRRKAAGHVASSASRLRVRNGASTTPLLPFYRSTCSEIASASSTSIPGSRTVLSSFVCPSNNWTARMLPVFL